MIAPRHAGSLARKDVMSAFSNSDRPSPARNAARAITNALLSMIGLRRVSMREVRAEAFFLGNRHQGEVLEGARRELQAPDLGSRPHRPAARRHPCGASPRHRRGPPMTDEEAQSMRRENDYLKRRNAQLQDDVTSLGGQVLRMQQEMERLSGRRTARASDPLSGGQS
jgi:hypothetical protein